MHIKPWFISFLHGVIPPANENVEVIESKPYYQQSKNKSRVYEILSTAQEKCYVIKAHNNTLFHAVCAINWSKLWAAEGCLLLSVM